jgi:hypothetical protein
MNWQRILTANPTEPIQFWSKPCFTAHSITYNISETLTEKELETICLQIQYLSGETRNENLHFVVLFPDNAGALFLAPKRGLFSDMINENMPGVFELAKQRITDTAHAIINGLQKRKASLSWNK